MFIKKVMIVEMLTYLFGFDLSPFNLYVFVANVFAALWIYRWYKLSTISLAKSREIAEKYMQQYNLESMETLNTRSIRLNEVVQKTKAAEGRYRSYQSTYLAHKQALLAIDVTYLIRSGTISTELMTVESVKHYLGPLGPFYLDSKVECYFTYNAGSLIGFILLQPHMKRADFINFTSNAEEHEENKTEANFYLTSEQLNNAKASLYSFYETACRAVGRLDLLNNQE